MHPILRILGFQAVGEVARRLPPAQARMIMLGVAVFANALPVAGVLLGRMTAADAFAAYWLELVIIGGFGVVRMVTATGEPRDRTGDRIARPVMFALVYGLMVTLQAMFLVLVFGDDVSIVAQYVDRIGFLTADGPAPSAPGWAAAAAGFFLSHLIALLLGWFARGERHLCSPRLAFMQPFGRMIPMLVVMSISGVGVVVLKALHLEVVLVGLLAAANLSLEFGRTGWMERIPGVGPLLQNLRPRERDLGEEPRRRGRG